MVGEPCSMGWPFHGIYFCFPSHGGLIGCMHLSLLRSDLTSVGTWWIGPFFYICLVHNFKFDSWCPRLNMQLWHNQSIKPAVFGQCLGKLLIVTILQHTANHVDNGSLFSKDGHPLVLERRKSTCWHSFNCAFVLSVFDVSVMMTFGIIHFNGKQILCFPLRREKWHVTLFIKVNAGWMLSSEWLINANSDVCRLLWCQGISMSISILSIVCIM